MRLHLHQVYNQWTQFEEFPRFMEGVKEVKQLDDTRLHWVAEIAGKEKQWTARILEQIPDHRIAWESESGEYTSGVVSFQALGPDRTRVTLEMIPKDLSRTREIRLEWYQDASRTISSGLKNLSKIVAKKPAPGVAQFAKATSRCLRRLKRSCKQILCVGRATRC
jgi:uncharacterized membrane protein